MRITSAACWTSLKAGKPSWTAWKPSWTGVQRGQTQQSDSLKDMMVRSDKSQLAMGKQALQKGRHPGFCFNASWAEMDKL